MSFRQFLNTRVGFAAVATMICGVSMFFGAGLAEEARLKERRRQLVESVIEEKVQEQLQKELQKN